MEKAPQRTGFMYILIQEPRQEDMTHASQFHLIDSDEFLLQRSLMGLQYLPSSLFGLFPSAKPFGAALQARRNRSYVWIAGAALEPAIVFPDSLSRSIGAPKAPDRFACSANLSCRKCKLPTSWRESSSAPGRRACVSFP